VNAPEFTTARLWNEKTRARNRKSSDHALHKSIDAMLLLLGERGLRCTNRAEFRCVFCRRVWHQQTRLQVQSLPELCQMWLRGLKSKDYPGERTQSRAQRLRPAFPLLVSTIPSPEKFPRQPRLFAAQSTRGERLSLRGRLLKKRGQRQLAVAGSGDLYRANRWQMSRISVAKVPSLSVKGVTGRTKPLKVGGRYPTFGGL
jgi:hypothetical protein